MTPTLTDCPRCGGSLEHVERTNDRTPTDHHNSVYRCGECGREVVSG